MPKPRNNISIAMNPEMQELLEKVATKKGVPISQLVREVIEKYVINDDEVCTIILKIPVNLTKDPPALQNWLECRILGIVKSPTS